MPRISKFHFRDRVYYKGKLYVIVGIHGQPSIEKRGKFTKPGNYYNLKLPGERLGKMAHWDVHEDEIEEEHRLVGCTYD